MQPCTTCSLGLVHIAPCTVGHGNSNPLLFKKLEHHMPFQHLHSSIGCVMTLNPLLSFPVSCKLCEPHLALHAPQPSAAARRLAGAASFPPPPSGSGTCLLGTACTACPLSESFQQLSESQGKSSHTSRIIFLATKHAMKPSGETSLCPACSLTCHVLIIIQQHLQLLSHATKPAHCNARKAHAELHAWQ